MHLTILGQASNNSSLQLVLFRVYILRSRCSIKVGSVVGGKFVGALISQSRLHVRFGVIGPQFGHVEVFHPHAWISAPQLLAWDQSARRNN